MTPRTSLDDRRAAALDSLARRQPPGRPRYPGETRPSGDLPDDPWQAEAYLAATRWLDGDESATPPFPGGSPPQFRATLEYPP